MTEDIGSDKHRRPSSAEIDVIKLKERYAALAADYAETKEVLRENQKTQISQLDIIIGKLSKIETGMAVGEQRFERIEENIKTVRNESSKGLDSVTARVEAIEADKRSPLAIALATISAIGAGAVAWFK